MSESQPSTGRKLARTSTSAKLRARAAEEADKAPFGWSLATITKFLKLATDEERLAQMFVILSVSEHDYQYDFKVTAAVDFHFANAFHCFDVGYDPRRTLFVCKTLNLLWDESVKSVQSPDINYETLRADLIDKLRVFLNEFNATDNRFSPKETQELLRFVTQAFIRPLRLLMSPFQVPPDTVQLQEPRKMHAPVRPVPLEQCNPERRILVEDEDFPMLPYFQASSMPLDVVRRMVGEYTDRMVEIINRRYDVIDQQMAHVLPLLNP
jgi:hypothetical protein